MGTQKGVEDLVYLVLIQEVVSIVKRNEQNLAFLLEEPCDGVEDLLEGCA